MRIIKGIKNARKTRRGLLKTPFKLKSTPLTLNESIKSPTSPIKTGINLRTSVSIKTTDLGKLNFSRALENLLGGVVKEKTKPIQTTLKILTKNFPYSKTLPIPIK
ncbi:MAG: hypothetical protein QXO71_05550 [Candidatus Jordarchaeaceae archaeon]